MLKKNIKYKIKKKKENLHGNLNNPVFDSNFFDKSKLQRFW